MWVYEEETIMKLYKIILKGCREIVNGVNLHESYVVAKSTDAAYAKLINELEFEGIGTKVKS